MRKGVLLIVLFVITGLSSTFAQLNLRREGNYKKGLAVASSNRKYGYIDEDNKVIIPIVYDEAQDFSDDGIAFVKKDGKWGAIDRKGNIIIPTSYFIIKKSESYQGIVYVGQRDPVNREINWGIYNNVGEGKTSKQIASCESIFAKKENLDLIMCNDYGVCVFGDHIYNNASGKFTSLLPKQYYVFNKNQAKEMGLVVITNHNIGRDFDDRLFGLYDLKNKTIAVDCIYKAMTICGDNTIAVKNQNDKTGVINKQGKVIIPFQYEHIDYFPTYKMFRVFVGYGTDNAKVGLINYDGTELCPTQYDYMIPFDSYGRDSESSSFFISAGIEKNSKQTNTIIARDGSIRKVDVNSIRPTGDDYCMNDNGEMYIVKDLLSGKYGIMVGHKPAIFPSGFREERNPLGLLYVIVDFMYDRIEKNGDYYFATNDNKTGILGHYSSLGRYGGSEKTNCCIYDDFKIIDAGNLIAKAIKDGVTYFIRYDEDRVFFSVNKSINRIKQISSNYDLWELVSDDYKHGVAKIVYNKGGIVIPCEYDETKMEDEVIIVKKENKYGVMNLDGKAILQCTYDNINSDGEVIVIKEDGKYGVVFNGGKKIPRMWFDDLDYKNRWNTGSSYRFWFKTDDKESWGLAEFQKDNSVEVLIKPKYDSVISYNRVKKGKNTYEISIDSHNKVSRKQIR